MGEPRIQEATMFALLFLLLFGICLLLAAAGRIWIDATPVDLPKIDSAAANHGSESTALDRISREKDRAV